MKKSKKQSNGVTGPRSVYLGDLYNEIRDTGKAIDRSASWVVRKCCELALPQVKQLSKGAP